MKQPVESAEMYRPKLHTVTKLIYSAFIQDTYAYISEICKWFDGTHANMHQF